MNNQHGFPRFNENSNQQSFNNWPDKKSNSMGLAGFITALVGLVSVRFHLLCFILWILGLVFSIIGMSKKPKGLAIAGLVISAITFILIIIILIGAAESYRIQRDYGIVL